MTLLLLVFALLLGAIVGAVAMVYFLIREIINHL
jgi:hypothetical protein